MKKSLQLFLLTFIIILTASASVFAQTGKIRGKITDSTNGDVLPGSNLIFKELSIGGAADFDGNYIITAIPVGTHKLTVSYLGCNSKDIDVTIVANRTLELDIELSPQVIEGEEVLITAQASAQQQAMNQQLSSKTIKSIVSRKQIQELPEANAAEAVGRLPGVSLERNGGEGTKVIIRGMAPKYTQVQIDGVAMAATGSGDRSSDLSMISPYMLEGIELTKSVMANQEATATGGIVNFRIKKAPDNMTFNVITQGGYNGLRESYKDYKISLGGSNRFFDKTLGVYAQVDYEEANRSSHQLGGVYFSQENLAAPIKTNSMQLIDIFRDVQRFGATAVIDYSLPSTEIKSSNFYSRINREETKYTNNYDFSQQGLGINYSDTPESWLTILTNSLQIDHRWKNWEINSAFSHSYSENILPANISSNINWPTISGKPFSTDRNSNYNVNLDPETIPDLVVNSIDDAAYSMTFESITHNESETSERDLTAELNLGYNFNITDKINVKLSFGGKIKHKAKEFDQETYLIGGEYYLDLIYENFEDQLSDRTKSSFAANDQSLYINDFWDKDYDGGGFLDGRYNISKVVDKEKFRRIHDLALDSYDPEGKIASLWDLVQNNFINSNYYDYDGTEDYYAFYIMPEIKIGTDLLIVPGVRYENNRTEYTGYRGNRLGVLRDWASTPVDTVTKKRNNEFFLPMIQAFYKPTEWLTLKAGYTHTLQRPNYNNIMPGYMIGSRGAIDNLSNFRLKPEKSRNWDLQLSLHSDKIGLISVGVFHKKITDMIFWTGQTVILDTAFFELPTLMHRQRAAYATNNPNDAINYGFELEWQSNFWYLPGLLSGLVVNVNYTRNKSEAKYLRTEIETHAEFDENYRLITYLIPHDTTYTSRMISQPDHLLNVTLGYDIKGFSFRWAMRYSSGIFKSNDWYEALRGYSTVFVRYDLSLRQQLPVDGLEMFLNVNNLTNEIEKDVINHRDYTRYKEDYGRSANLGIRYQF
ncbi:MAG: TonB-dependent receptor [Melioribacteraceae bacterium]|nr:TonB-dependent receptor [Melioribacteraceae bacterium]